MIITVQTVIVASANFLVAVISIALMLLVLWQAPHERGNQIFAFMMLNLLVFSIVNVTHRFAGVLGIDPDVLLDANTTLYVWFILLLIMFVEVFTMMPIRWIKLIGFVLTVGTTILLMSNTLHSNAYPSPSDPGGYVVDYTPLGMVAVVANVAYLFTALVMMGRSHDARPRSLFPAMVCLFAGIVGTLARPLSTYLAPHSEFLGTLMALPYNSLGLAAAAVIIGRAVLKYQLFDPIHQLNIELERANRDLEQASKLKSQFLANMSHELRTPLNSILGYTQLTLQGVYGPVTEAQNDRLARVVHNGQNLLALINDLLDISKIEAGRMEIMPGRVNTVDLIRDVLAIVEPLAQTKNLTLVCGYADAPAIWADRERARQILLNIASNAVKFTHRGTISIRASADDSYVRISVQDTGIGIPKESLKTIFEEFRQVDESLTRQYDGTGLGLAIARHLAEMQGGRIDVESEIGVGSTFHMLLPLASAVPSGDHPPIATTNATA